MLNVKRAYELPEEADGRRILVDGLWPRGVSKHNNAVALREYLKKRASR